MKYFFLVALLTSASISAANQATEDSREKFLSKYGACLTAIEKRNVAQLGSSNIIVGNDYLAINSDKGLEMYSEKVSTVISSTGRECNYSKKSVSEGIKKALTGDPSICADCVVAGSGEKGKALQKLSIVALEVCGKVDEDLASFAAESLKAYGNNTSTKKPAAQQSGVR